MTSLFPLSFFAKLSKLFLFLLVPPFLFLFFFGVKWLFLFLIYYYSLLNFFHYLFCLIWNICLSWHFLPCAISNIVLDAPHPSDGQELIVWWYTNHVWTTLIFFSFHTLTTPPTNDKSHSSLFRSHLHLVYVRKSCHLNAFTSSGSDNGGISSWIVQLSNCR